MSRKPIVFAASVIMVICFSIAGSLLAHTSPGVALAAAPGRLSLEALKNTEYSSDNATGGKAKLTDGVYREKYDANSATELVVTLTEPVAYGDLNGDGVEDAAVVLVADPGGSGTFYYLSAVLNDNGKPKSVSTVLLGDRIKLKDLAIAGGAIAANIVTQGPADPMCCPTQDETRTFKLQDGTLVEPSAAPTPTLVDEKRVGLNPGDIQLQPGKTASSFKAELEALQPYDSESANPHSAAPAHIKVTFDNDKLNRWFDPRDRQLLIYPVEAWQEMYRSAGDPYVDARIKRLNSLLADRPPVIDSQLPVLPSVPDLAPFVTRFRYVDFPGGSGIRFVGLHGPEHTPVTNDTIFYSFQGLTSDGKYYISFFAPLSTAALKNTVQEAAAPGEPSLADYDSYLAEMVSRLDGLTPEDFTPPPPQFDEMMKSLQLGGGTALTAGALKNAEYTSDVTATGKARLVNGAYEEPIPDSAAKVAIRLSDLMAFSDLNGDGAGDAVAVLVSSGGGTGRFYDLVAMLNKDGQPVQAAKVQLGDRVQLRSMAVDGNKAVIDMVTQGPDDGACCPTLKVRKTYAFENSGWKELSSEEQGTVSLSDLEGVTWRLTELNKSLPLVEGTEITATFANGKISGSAGCNNYSAALTLGEQRPTAVTVGPAMSTRKACPEPVMTQEAEYLSALQVVTQLGFDDGNLSLVSADTDNNPRWLNFTPAQPAGPARAAAVPLTEPPAQPTAAATVAAAPSATQSDAWQPVACDAFGVALNIAKIADCGYVTVPENRAAGTDKTIQLAVVRVRSTGQNPGAPVVLGTGGPGGNGLAKASDASFTQTHADILADRDWVFFSQRGTVHARPELVCPDYNLVPFEAAEKGWADEQKRARSIETMKACLDGFRTQGVDLTGYNSVENAADIVDISRALGYKTIIYYGESYGTLLGQFLLRSHPELLEAIILDGIAPATAERWTDVTDISAAFRRVFAACAQDAACAAQYPDPEGALAKAMATLKANPPELTMPLGDGKQMTIKADETLAMNALFLNLYAPGGYAKVPRIAYQMSKGGFSPLNATLRLLFANSGTARVMHFAMACSDDPTVSLDELNLKGVPEFYANLIVDDGATYTTNCPMFKLPQLPASSDELVVSKVPALLLQGGLEPATPVSGGNTLQDGLSNSFNVIVPAGSHIQGGSPCALKIMDAFMSNPRATPDTSCIEPAIRFAVPGPVSVKSDGGGATLTVTLPEGFDAVQGTGVWAGDDMNVALLVSKPGSTAEDVLADLLAAVPLQNVEKTDGPALAGYPSRILKGEITAAGLPHNVQAFAFADKTRAYRIVFDVTNPAKVDEILQTTLPSMLKSATVGGK